MGKSNRIRADRARRMMNQPEKYRKDDSARKAKTTSIILICVIAAIIISSIALIAFNKSGAINRTMIVARTDNYQVTGTMAAYMYWSQYNYQYSYLYQYFGAAAGNYISSSSVASTVSESMKQTLAFCEAAKKEGITLGDLENRLLEKSLKSITQSASNSGYSLSAYYGNVGVNLSDIRNVLELEYLASKYEKEYTNKLVAEYGDDSDMIEAYLEAHKHDLIYGKYVSVTTENAEWLEKLGTATTADEFKTFYIDLYTKENLVNAFNNSSKTPAKVVAEKLEEAVIDWIIYKNLGTLPENVTVTDDMTTKQLLKAFYEADPAEKVDGVLGIFDLSNMDASGASNTANSSDSIATTILKSLAKKAEEINNAIVSADLEAATDKASFLKEKVKTAMVKHFVDSSSLPTLDTLNSFYDVIADLVAFVGYEVELEGEEELTASSTVTKDLVKKLYEKDGKTATDAVYTSMAATANEIIKTIKDTLTVDNSHFYPTVSEAEKDKQTTATDTTTGADDTTAEGSDTTADTTTAAGTTTAGETTTASPADFEELSPFNQKFFSDAKENDIITDGNKIYFVVQPGIKNTTVSKNVAHILVGVNKVTAVGTGEAAESEADAKNEQLFADAYPTAEKILAEFNKGDKTLASFEALGNKYTDDSGVIYYNVKKDVMVEEFENWIYDEARKEGDTAIVKTEYGYHVMYFIGNGLTAWEADAVNHKVAAEIDAAVTEQTKSIEVNSSMILNIVGK